jgi:hypothetical protein
MPLGAQEREGFIGPLMYKQVSVAQGNTQKETNKEESKE